MGCFLAGEKDGLEDPRPCGLIVASRSGVRQAAGHSLIVDIPWHLPFPTEACWLK